MSWKFRVGKNDMYKVKLTIFKHSVFLVFFNEQIFFVFILAGIVFKHFHKFFINNNDIFKCFLFSTKGIFKLSFKLLVLTVALNQQIMFRFLVCTGCCCVLRNSTS